MNKASNTISDTHHIHSTLAHPKYRPDIDGLRAVAVLSVVIFHAFPSMLKGGFVGVDIFFTISGYLISSILINSLNQESFSFSDFYGRRVRRIFPALIVVLLTCYAFGWVSLYADEYKQLGKHIAAGAGFVSNLVLWSESGYFDAAAEAKPLLHLWSLGVEEQFYLFLPLLLWLSWRMRLNLIYVITIAAALSLYLNLAQYKLDSVADFYSPQTRFWEMLFGSLLAYITINPPKSSAQIGEFLNRRIAFLDRTRLRLSLSLRDIQSALGCTLIGLSILFTKEHNFPGIMAIIPVLGTILVISSGSSALINRHILSSRIFVSFGLISYPLYLWHWPILSFLRIEVESPTAIYRLLAVLGCILLAWLTYNFIEKPLRYLTKMNLIATCMLFAMAIVGTLGYATYKLDGIKSRLEESQTRKTHPFPTVMQSKDYETSKLAGQLFLNAIPNSSRDFFLHTESPNSNFEIAVIGDSHANRLYFGMKDISSFSGVNLGRGTCPPFLGVDVTSKESRSFECQPLTDNYIRYVASNSSIKVIVLNAFYGQYNRDVYLSDNGNSVTAADGLARTIDFLTSNGKVVIVSMDVPEVPKECYSRRLPVWVRNSGERCVIDQAAVYESSQHIREAVLSAKAKSSKVFLYDPASVLCSDNVCGEIDGDNYLYTVDGNHLNEFGIKVVGDDLFKMVSQALREK